MPDLPPDLVNCLQELLERYLNASCGKCTIEFVASGGSAAVFKVTADDAIYAYKVYDPRFLSGERSPAEHRRLDLQKTLVGHACPSLVQVYEILEFEDTAIAKMEFLSWPTLKKSLTRIPDEKIENLIVQLVNAVVFLDDRGIVHRDIKPENIHISLDFNQLKLLDLGVVREIYQEDVDSVAATDHGALRPFIATAQYSSPEYLFRLDAPSPELWKGLSIYQVGAVLHDMLMKRPLFGEIVDLGNRWLLARAVLEKVPSLDDAKPGRLLRLKALAVKALSKDLKNRLSMVDWKDFVGDKFNHPSVRLRDRISRGSCQGPVHVYQQVSPKLSEERHRFLEHLRDKLRSELLQILGQVYYLEAPFDPNARSKTIKFVITIKNIYFLTLMVGLEWGSDFQERSAKIKIAAFISGDRNEMELKQESWKIVCLGNIDTKEFEVLALDLIDHFSLMIEYVLDRLETEESLNIPCIIDMNALSMSNV